MHEYIIYHISYIYMYYIIYPYTRKKHQLETRSFCFPSRTPVARPDEIAIGHTCDMTWTMSHPWSTYNEGLKKIVKSLL